MSLNAVVQNGIDTAFRMLDDLKKDVTFHKRTSSHGYDFATRASTPVTEDSTIVEAVVIKDEKVNGRKTNSRKVQLLYPTEDVGELAQFDRVSIEGEDWKIGKSPMSSTGHISFVECYQEVNRG